MTRGWDEGESKHQLCSVFITLGWNLTGMIWFFIVLFSVLPSRTGPVYDTQA